MNIYHSLCEREGNLAVVGLGYVGLPLAVEFSKKISVLGFDVNINKIKSYMNRIDITNEVGNQELEKSNIHFTSSEEELGNACFYIIAVPTPIHADKTPDLGPLISASEVVGRNLGQNTIVVFESTVYPGLTENVCIPILEKTSGLKAGTDFKVGYSPERINPGDKKHRLNNIVKIVSGMDEECLEIIANVYSLIVDAGVYKAETIKVAEAAKVIENSQRDINIAFMNELSIIFNKMGIDTQAVLKAANTKWNFLGFAPGLVGGHCIGVDPYYLTYIAEQIGYHPQVILSGRRINDTMGKYIAESVIKQMIKANRQIKGSKVLIMGMTFKENVPDTRNTKVIDIVYELKEYGVEVIITDPIAYKEEVLKEYGMYLSDYEQINEVDAIVVAVSHDLYKSMDLDLLKSKYNDGNAVLIDVKGIFDSQEANRKGYIYWRL